MPAKRAGAGVSDPRLARSLLFAFSLPAIMQGFMHAPENLVQGIYAKHTGLSLTAMAGALLLTRLLDAFTYPLIGYLSDRAFQRTGTRKPWIVIGTAVTITGLWFLYRPPAEVTVVYFGCWTAVTYIGWKLTEIPYTAWGIELSGDYVQRARIQLWRGVAMLAGGFVFFAMPYLGQALGRSTGTELNLDSLSLTAVVVVMVLPLLNAWSLLRVPDGEISAASAANPAHRPSARASAKAMLENRPFLLLMAAFIPITMLNGMATGVGYLYIDAYLRLGEHLPSLMMVTAPAALLSLPLWGWACMRFERHRVWALSSLAGSAVYAAMLFLEPGPSALQSMMVLYPIAGFCVLCSSIAVPSMLGDVADFGRWKSGIDSAGQYAAGHAFVVKSLGGLSAAAGFALVGWFGFDATAEKQTTSGALGIQLAAVALPALGLALGGVIAWFFPIDRRRQTEIRDALARRC